MLGKWAVLDIETSGVDPTQDRIIDIGFVLYENDQFIEEQSLLISFEHSLDPVIIALTGISLPLLKSKSIPWSESKSILEKLQDVVIIAHNASFEESFLKNYFVEWNIKPKCTDEGKYFHDSLEVLPFLLPYIPRLGLESINQILGVISREQHRGIEDAKDLLKALFYAQTNCEIEKRKQIAGFDSISSWWKKWLTYDFQQVPNNKSSKINISEKKINQWNQVALTEYAKTIASEQSQWLVLKLAQMLGRGISGIISKTDPESMDLETIFKLSYQFLHNFPNKKIVVCSAYFSPDETFWFKSVEGQVSTDQLACTYFKKYAEFFIPLLNLESQTWSKNLLSYYLHQDVNFSMASRVPDFWCRQDDIINVLWKSSKYLARVEIGKRLKNVSNEAVLVLQPAELYLLHNIEDAMVIFWQAKQLDWNNDFNVKKIRFSDVEYVLQVCLILKKLDVENIPTIDSAEKLLLDFDKILKSYMSTAQESDAKKVYWDVDFKSLSQHQFSTWAQDAKVYLKRRSFLKTYQSELHDSLWWQLDEVVQLMLHACSEGKFGLSWKANQENTLWDLWMINEPLNSIHCTKVFFDYAFDEGSKEYWNSVFGLNKIEKNKRFEKIQFQVANPAEDITTTVLEELNVNKIVEQIKTYTEKGPILFYSQDQSLGTNIYSSIVQEQKLNVATWSEFIRMPNQGEVNIVFMWDKDFRYEPIKMHSSITFNTLLVDRIPDLSWFAWAQSLWKERANCFDMSTFEAYWFRRASLLREKFFPLAIAVNASELVVFDSRKNKWKGDSWRFLKNFILQR